jgi:hypothetical protein
MVRTARPETFTAIVHAAVDHANIPIGAQTIGSHAARHAATGVDPITSPLNVEALAKTLEHITRFTGLYWFCENWYPANLIYVSTSGSASVAWSTALVQGSTGTTSGSYVKFVKEGYGLALNTDWGKRRILAASASWGTNTNQNIWIVSGYAPETGSTNTTQHIGFKVINNTLYGTVGNGTNESTLLLETYIGGATRRLECILDPSVPECRFYVDGVDKGAITTNLPSGGAYAGYLFSAVVNNTAAENKSLSFRSVRIYQEE